MTNEAPPTVRIDGGAVLADLAKLRMYFVSRREYDIAGVIHAGCEVIAALLPPPPPPELEATPEETT